MVDHSATPEELLLGLRRIAEAKGMSRVAEAAGLSRESLYRSLSAAGNPRLSTLVAVLRVAGSASERATSELANEIPPLHGEAHLVSLTPV